MFWTLYLIAYLPLHRLVVFLELWSVLSFGPYLFVLEGLLCCKGRGLRYSPGAGQPTLLCSGAVCWGGVWGEQCHLHSSGPSFSHFHCYPQANWAFLVLIPKWVGLCTFPGPHGPLQLTLLWDWQFFSLLQPPQVFSVTGFEALFPPNWNPGLCRLSHSPVVPPGLSSRKCGTARFSSCRFAGSSSPPLLLVWMNVSSLTPWLLDFCTVWFSGSSDCFLFF